MISLETICPPIKLLQYYQSYSLCCIPTWIIYFKMGDWQLLIPFTYCTPSPLATTHLFSVLFTIAKIWLLGVLGYINLFKNAFVHFGQIHENENAGLYVSNILNFLSNLHSVFHSGCTSAHRQCMRVPFSPHPRQYMLPFDNRHSDRCEVASLCGFDLHFPDGQ